MWYVKHILIRPTIDSLPSPLYLDEEDTLDQLEGNLTFLREVARSLSGTYTIKFVIVELKTGVQNIKHTSNLRLITSDEAVWSRADSCKNVYVKHSLTVVSVQDLSSFIRSSMYSYWSANGSVPFYELEPLVALSQTLQEKTHH